MSSERRFDVCAEHGDARSPPCGSVAPRGKLAKAPRNGLRPSPRVSGRRPARDTIAGGAKGFKRGLR